MYAYNCCSTDPDVPKMNEPLPVFIQQAAAAKTVGYDILVAKPDLLMLKFQ